MIAGSAVCGPLQGPPYPQSHGVVALDITCSEHSVTIGAMQAQREKSIEHMHALCLNDNTWCYTDVQEQQWGNLR